MNICFEGLSVEFKNIYEFLNTVQTPDLKDGHLDLTDGHLDLTDGHLHLKHGHLHLTDGHHTWRTVTLFDWWIFYFHELFICLTFSLLKVISAISDLYSFYCLTIIIYNFFENEGYYPVFSNIIRSSLWIYSEKRIWSWIKYQYRTTIKDCTIVVVGFSKQHQNSNANLS